MNESPEPIRGARWVSYAAVLWCLLFGGLHLYWAVGGTVGFAAMSMPPNKILALNRDSLYIGITWGVVLACAFGIFLALASIQNWGRRIPKWLLLIPLWIACIISLVRGIGTMTQTALIIAGVFPFEPLVGPEAIAWYRYLLIDSIFYSPWFICGGILFGATAWSARRRGVGIVRLNMFRVAGQR
jgi:hypothetical protein